MLKIVFGLVRDCKRQVLTFYPPGKNSAKNSLIRPRVNTELFRAQQSVHPLIS